MVEQVVGIFGGHMHSLRLLQLWHPSHGYVNNWDGARGEYFRDYKQA